jgi:hypothetical protein
VRWCASQVINLSTNNVVVYSIDDEDVLDRPVAAVVEEVSGKPLAPGTRYLLMDVLVEDMNSPDDELELPPVRVVLA